MKTIKKKIVLKEGETELKICSIGDVHLGQRYHDFKTYKRNIDWLKANEGYQLILMGDMIECATTRFKEDQILDIDEQIDQIIDDFMPMKDRIWGILQGNHEFRGIKDAGMNPTHRIAKALGIKNLGVGAVFYINVRPRGVKRGQNYKIYAKHGSSGASRPSGRINALLRMREIVVNADIYLMGHAHVRMHHIESPYEIDRGHTTMLVQHFIITGSYLLYEGSYGDRRSYTPSSPSGSARLKLHADKKLITVKE